MEVQEGRTYLTVLHEGGKLTFQHPSFRGTYGNITQQIDSQNLERPISSQTASLVYDASQNPKGNYESQIISILRNVLFWEFTGNLYVPKGKEDVQNGVLLEDNPQIVNGRLQMDKQSLIKRLQDSDDKSVRFVPFGYKTGEQTHNELERNPYIIARYGEEGAQEIAKIASEFRFEPILWALDSIEEEAARMSALNGNWVDDRLNVGGNNWFDSVGGHSFGVLQDSKNQ